LSKSGYATEVEIKISKQDIKNDLKKHHKHRDYRIKRLYFAIPEYLSDCADLIPEHAGVLVVKKKYNDSIYYRVSVLRQAEETGKYKFGDKERCELYRLGALRIWSLKKKISRLKG